MKRVMCILVLAFVVLGCVLPTAYEEPETETCTWIIETEYGETLSFDSFRDLWDWGVQNPMTEWWLVEVICD